MCIRDSPEDIPFHRAIDDTIYTVRVMQKMDLEAVKQYISVDYFLLPDKKEEELSLVFDRYAKSLSLIHILCPAVISK